MKSIFVVLCMLIGMIGGMAQDKKVTTVQEGDNLIFKGRNFVYVDIFENEYYLKGVYTVNRVDFFEDGELMSIEIIDNSGNKYNLQPKYLIVAEQKNKLIVCSE